MKMIKNITHSKSAIQRWIYALHITSRLLSDAGACDAYSQPAEAVSGSDQVVWPSGESWGRQWPHCVAEVPLVSMTLPATETGRSKMAERRESRWCLSWFKQDSFDPFWMQIFFGGGSYQSWEVLKVEKSSAVLRRLICWHFIYFKETDGERGRRESMWEKFKRVMGGGDEEGSLSLNLSSSSSKSSLARPEVELRCLKTSKKKKNLRSSFWLKRQKEKKILIVTHAEIPRIKND